MVEFVRYTKSKKPTLEELQGQLQREGLPFEMYSDPPGVKYGRHKHDFDDFIVIVSGKMKILTDTEEWVMKPGDRINLPARTSHSAEVVGKEPVSYLSAAK
jgi:mannose-6-phosphate isomerase-like protein (cupin superfamily)